MNDGEFIVAGTLDTLSDRTDRLQGRVGEATHPRRTLKTCLEELQQILDTVYRQRLHIGEPLLLVIRRFIKEQQQLREDVLPVTCGRDGDRSARGEILAVYDSAMALLDRLRVLQGLFDRVNDAEQLPSAACTAPLAEMHAQLLEQSRSHAALLVRSLLVVQKHIRHNCRYNELLLGLAQTTTTAIGTTTSSSSDDTL
ncbi:uncharacterized protein KNAG_0K00430 [Huiozyma naganishii CBS 8797]|uniref:Uncharacterized protein n=1 Tax=Huiozyma naganishii (strain ATCC MYA-139 / BCRC 22969 / CBS 8797 / KCTC 17520 / NBRC 10181 / NCYC 3082 / Yp74L-3) TaxID=1071383 RepID=J7SAR3_HUIN7|nr:hypothetical protein KNAG_0K00430 [Kazachstania naganishii CBS 8797]CCK72411.1 hypothetical protein KNAG_0K00430 [Kazachstania naganishii CBS 8797]